MTKQTFIQAVLLAFVAASRQASDWQHVIVAAVELQLVPEAQFYNSEFDVRRAAEDYVRYRFGRGPKPEFLVHAGV